VLGHTGGGFGWRQTAALSLGALLVVAGASLAPLAEEKQPTILSARVLWVAIGLMGVLVLWSRLASLDQSLWHDEVFSVVHYITAGPETIVTGHWVPNNHVLYSLLSFGTTRVLGESEVTFRLWSVLPAIAAAGVVVWWAWRVLGRWTALAVAVLVATSPIHHDLAREARGYGLMFLAGALMLVFAYRVATGGGRADWVWLGIAGVVGAYTAPQFALGFVGQAIPLLWLPDLRRRALVMLGIVGVVLLLLYAPLLSDIARSPETVSGGPLAWHGVLSGPILHLLQPTFDVLAGRETDAYLITPNRPDRILAGAILLIGALLLWRSRARMLCALLVVPVLFTYSVFVIARFHVHERYGSFLIFHVLVLAAVGVVGLVRAVPSGAPRHLAGAVAAAGAVVLVIQTVDRSDTYHELPRENFKRVAEIVKARGGSEVVTDSTRPDGLRYYLGEDNVVALPPGPAEPTLCVTPPPIFVEHPYRADGEPPPPDVSCLKRLGAVRVRVPQRDRGDHIDVWISTP
jgi:hypothetical protein